MSATPAPAARRGNGPVIVGLLLGVLLAALDQAVVGPSVLNITRDVGGFEHMAWLFSAYMLASTVVIPLAGKFSDLYGRRPIYILGMSIFLLGSALCGTATSMPQLILYRAIQGLGGGALFPVALATIADLYAPSERGRVSGGFGAVFGLSSVIGPFLGGWIVDHVHLFGVDSWRWIFYVNVPVGIAAITMVSLFFPRVSRRSTAPIDYLGIATLTTALVSVLLVAVWGGETYAWTSPQVLGLAALALLATGAFVLVERRAEDPVIPPALFREPIFAVSAAASFIMGAGMFTVMVFMPSYLQTVLGVSASYSGSTLIPLSLSLVGASILSGFLVKRVGYKPFAVGGTLIAAVGFTALWLLPLRPPVWLVMLEMVVIGIGLGFTIQTFILAVQNAVSRRHTGVATSSITLFRTLGVTIGVTALGVLLNRRVSTELPARVPMGDLEPLLQHPLSGGRIERIPSLIGLPGFDAPPAVVEGIRDAFAASVSGIWVASALLCLAALGVTLFLRSIPVKGAEEYHATEPAPAPGH